MINSGRPVKDIIINKDSSIEKILEEMEKSGGFESRNVADGVEILSTMINLSLIHICLCRRYAV